jgi:nucleotide-binding universal stress UspA family protein
MKRIIACIDFSPVSEAVIKCATAIARAFSSTIALLHVADPEPDFVGFRPGPEVARDARAESFRDHHRRLQEYAQSLRSQGLDADAFSIQGSTIDTILNRIDHLHADLLVIGITPHGVLYRALIGSTTEGILRRSPVPILAVPMSTPNGEDSKQ